MIREILIPAVIERYPGTPMSVENNGNLALTIHALHPDVGEVRIYDDGDEATVSIGEITHGHFNPYNSSLSEEALAREVTREVIEFLDDLLSDRVLLWKSLDSRSAGWSVAQTIESADGEPGDRNHFRWSGPIGPNHDHA